MSFSFTLAEIRKVLTEARRTPDYNMGSPAALDHLTVHVIALIDALQGDKTMDSIEVTDQQSQAVQKTPNRVSLDSIKDKIAEVAYLHPEMLPSMTICLMKMANGFVLVGQSAPADPANFNAALGIQFAEEDAIRQVWQLEGYLLREKLAGSS